MTFINRCLAVPTGKWDMQEFFVFSRRFSHVDARGANSGAQAPRVGCGSFELDQC